MGQEIHDSHFSAADFQGFAERLRSETERLAGYFQHDWFSHGPDRGGYELEAWLVDGDGAPAPINDRFLAQVGDQALVSPELSRFNIELNSTPEPLSGAALGNMHRELQRNWQRCRQCADQLQAKLLMVGTLPTLRDDMLTLANMSDMERYRALNEQVLRLRQGKPLELNIQGAEHLHSRHHDLMLEAATTSFQLHWQVTRERAVRYYNAMIILSAPMVAVSANSPMLFGRRLWNETRIPLFEQAVAVGGFSGAAFGPVRRVTFGSGYARSSLLEVFRENLDHYPVLLPVDLSGEAQQLPHLRLHNGTIWRWNRPLVGFDDDGSAHLRIEHRVVPAGPSVIDSIANAAFFFGLVHALASAEAPPEGQLEFARARENFYAAAKHSLKAPVVWLDGSQGSMLELLRERLLPQARQGLQALGCAAQDIDTYLGVIEQRLGNGRTGSAWQLAYLDHHGPDLAALVHAYAQWQDSGAPVAAWAIDRLP